MKGHVSILLYYFLILLLRRFAEGGKTATKVGLAGVAATAGGSLGGYQTGDQTGISVHRDHIGNITRSFKNEVERLQYNLLVRQQYDRSLRPVKNKDSILSVVLDLTLRQIMDLDEKNQVLKAYIWMKHIWTDEFLAWNKTEYGGIETIWLPAAQVWRPDIVIYEDTGQRDYNPRLPYYRIEDDGKVVASEPIVIETTCSIDIAFFPFDVQRCSFTFTSWTFPSHKLDIFSARDTERMMEHTNTYFLATGEWTIQEIDIVKTSQSFASLLKDAELVDEIEEEFHETEEHHDEEGDHHGDEGDHGDGHGFHEGDIPPIDTSKIRRIAVDITKTVEEVFPDRITSHHWADIKFTFVLRRNSSLYMQSMLFPAILLTTVAFLGFYLPPDSGERIGLQITILLTFMVFLLTVGEMFPASTGPFLGVYYVLCMILLGINLFMTVLVLHLHYMSSAAVLGVREGEIFIKEVPAWARLMLRIAKFRFKNEPLTGRESPTTQIVLNIIKTKQLCTKVSSNLHNDSLVAKQNGIQNGSFQSDDSQTKLTDQDDMISTKKSSFPTIKAKVTPMPYNDTKNSIPETVYQPIEITDDTSNSSLTSNDTTQFDSKENQYLRQDKKVEKFYESIHRNMEKIQEYLQTQNDNLKETTMGEEIETEWKAMARTIDNLCMKTYVMLLIFSHIVILATAFTQGATYSHEGHAH